MGTPFSSAGVKVGWALAGSATEAPTSFYELPDITGTPDTNQEPSTIDVTTLAETVAKQYIPGLRDYGVMQFGGNFTEELNAEWDYICDEFDKASEDKNTLWLEIWIPEATEAGCLPCAPVDRGLSAIEVDAKIDNALSVTPLGGLKWIEPAEPTARAKA